MLQTLLDVPGEPDARRRGRMVIIIALLLFVLNLIRSPAGLVLGAGLVETVPATLIGIAGTLGSIWLARRGQVGVAAWMLILLAMLVISATPLIRGQLIIPVIFLTLPVFLAGLMVRPWQVWIATIIALATLALLVRLTAGTNWHGGEVPLLISLSSLIGAVGVIGFVAARVSTAVLADAAAARRDAEVAARRFEELNAGLEARVSAQTTDLRRALGEVEARAAAQAALLAENEAQRTVIREMSFPVLPVSRDTLVIPLVGALDSVRLADLQARALEAVERMRARILLLDITGVSLIDTQVAQGLIGAVQATRLLGAEPVLIGVRPEVAQTLVTLGIDLTQVRTAASLASALGHSARRG